MSFCLILHFLNENGSITCKELLDGTKFFKLNKTNEPYFNGRPCRYLIMYAAAYLEEYISNNNVKFEL